jgi:hypothetical protein
MSVRDFITSVPGIACILMVRILIASFLMCSGIELFDFKKLSPFFTFKRVVSFFLLIFGSRLLINALFIFDVS